MSGNRLQLVYVGNQVQLQPCSACSVQHPLIEEHHLCPESWWHAANLPVQSPFRKLCPNCHMGTHCAIDGLIGGHDVSLFDARWIELAKEALALAEANGLTPGRTL